MTFLYPQLSAGSARRILAQDVLPRTASAIFAEKLFSGNPHQEAVFSATGGNRIGSQQIFLLIEKMTECADGCGFPDPPTPASRQRFDYLAAELLRRRMPVTPAEASRPGVWNHLCCVGLPHIVRWRFPDDKEERFLSGRRNTFERLWRRAYLLHDPVCPDSPLWLLKELHEDELVQLMERPQLHGRPDLARETARLFLEELQAGRDAALPRRDLFREMQKRLRRLGAVVEFDALSDVELVETLRDVLARTYASLDAAEG